MARGELPAIYGERAAAVVVFVSAEYAVRDWSRLERRAALSRAVRERREYVLAARLMTHHWPGCCPMLNRLGESRAFGSSGAVQSARRYLARLNSTQEQPIVSTGRGQGSWRWWPASHSAAELVVWMHLGSSDRRSVAPAGTGGPDC
jgi:hypothetical protein